MKNHTGSDFVNPMYKDGEIMVVRYLKETYLLLCNSCFWCASYFSRKMILTDCPVCKMDSLESMPISGNEEYLIDYGHKQGLVLEFRRVLTA